jgi:FkbM family methyltransferase
LIEGVKTFARRHFPAALGAVHSFRYARQLHARKACTTPLGFHFGGHRAMENGTFEPAETALISGFSAPGRVFVDVGANYGFFTCLARQQGAHVIAIEPLLSNLEILYRNLKINGWDDIEVLPLGLSSQPGIARIYGGGVGASLVKGWAGVSETWNTTIALSTLDIVISDRFAGKPLQIKVDVEGLELQVLQGAVRVLTRSPAPVWLVEIVLTEHHPLGMNPFFRQVFDIFRAAGYTAYALGAQERVVIAEDVSRWIANRQRDFGDWSYVFRKHDA